MNEIFWHYLVPMGIAFLLAWIFGMISGRLIRRFVGLTEFAPRELRPRQERQHTLGDLLASAFNVFGFVIAGIFSLGLIIDTTTLVWMMGLFSAAFGLGARPLISDYMTGVSFIFGDVFDVGEKVEIFGVEGVIEKISLRTITLRSPTGELYIVPNGEIRLIRNFSRGRFSMADVRIKVHTEDLSKAVALLERLAVEAVELLPNLLEPWQVISTSGEMGQQTELVLMAKARFGKAAEMRPRLLALVQERLALESIRIGGV